VKRHLSLRTERLTELTPGELRTLAAAGAEDSIVCVDLPTRWQMCALVDRVVNDALYTLTSRGC
jgi:hypothetical protein